MGSFRDISWDDLSSKKSTTIAIVVAVILIIAITLSVALSSTENGTSPAAGQYETDAPTGYLASILTTAPSVVPTTRNPTVSPTAPTASPSSRPTVMPSQMPTAVPTEFPTANPTYVPTIAPSNAPSASPTDIPTGSPLAQPTSVPTISPTSFPTVVPTVVPTLSPTVPTAVPSARPTLPFGNTHTPTSAAPVTHAPVTSAPTSIAPTSVSPTTVAPSTFAPTTLSPTSKAPTTVSSATPTSDAPVTLVPTTLSPVSPAPTTVAPVTYAPSTIMPTSLEPTTTAPTTLVPSSLSLAPSTVTPTSYAPVTLAPTTRAPSSLAPVSAAPAMTPPTTDSPTSIAPTTLKPTSLANIPTTIAPTSVAPTTNAPTTFVPTTIVPSTHAPTTFSPVTANPTTWAPTTHTPTSIAPSELTHGPTTVSPTTISPTTVAPTTSTPTTDAPVTFVPTSIAPVTTAPTSAAPVTWAPTFSAPPGSVSSAPTSIAPTTHSPTTVTPTSQAPTTLSPTSDAPFTFAPVTFSPTSISPTTVAPTLILLTQAPTNLPTFGPTTSGSQVVLEVSFGCNYTDLSVVPQRKASFDQDALVEITAIFQKYNATYTAAYIAEILEPVDGFVVTVDGCTVILTFQSGAIPIIDVETVAADIQDTPIVVTTIEPLTEHTSTNASAYIATFRPTISPTFAPTNPFSPTAAVRLDSDNSSSTSTIWVGAVLAASLLILLILFVKSNKHIRGLLKRLHMPHIFFRGDDNGPLQPKLPQNLQNLVDSGSISPEQAHRIVAEELADETADALNIYDEEDPNTLPTLPAILKNLVETGVVSKSQAVQVWSSVLPLHLRRLVDEGHVTSAQAHAIAADCDSEEHVSASDKTKTLPPLPPHLRAEVRSGLISREQADALWDAELAHLIRCDLEVRAAEATSRNQLQARLAQRLKLHGSDDPADTMSEQQSENNDHQTGSMTIALDGSKVSTALPQRLEDFVSQGVMSHSAAENVWLSELGRAELALNTAEDAVRDVLLTKLKQRIGHKWVGDSVVAHPDVKGPPQRNGQQAIVSDGDLHGTVPPTSLTRLVSVGRISALDADKVWLDELLTVNIPSDAPEAQGLSTLVSNLRRRITARAVAAQNAGSSNVGSIDPFNRSSLRQVPLSPRLSELTDQGVLSTMQAKEVWEAILQSEIRADLSVRCAQASANDKLQARIKRRLAAKSATNAGEVNVTVDHNHFERWKHIKLVIGTVARLQKNAHGSTEQPSVLPQHVEDLVYSGVITHEQALKTMHAELGRSEIAVASAQAHAQATLQAKLAARIQIASKMHNSEAHSHKNKNKKMKSRSASRSRKKGRRIHPEQQRDTLNQSMTVVNAPQIPSQSLGREIGETSTDAPRIPPSLLPPSRKPHSHVSPTSLQHHPSPAGAPGILPPARGGNRTAPPHYNRH